jgi:hypothetical protein
MSACAASSYRNGNTTRCTFKRVVARSACSGTHARAEIKRHRQGPAQHDVVETNAPQLTACARFSDTRTGALGNTSAFSLLPYPSGTSAVSSLLIGYVRLSLLQGLYHIQHPLVKPSETLLGTRSCG